LHGRARQTVLDGVFVDIAEDLVTTILELSLDMLSEVGLVIPVGEVARRRPRLGTHDHHDVSVAGDNCVARLGHELLRTLAADRLQHYSSGIAAQAIHRRARVVVGLAESGGHRSGDLELTQAEYRVDGFRNGSHVDAGVGQRGFGRGRRQVYSRHAPVLGVVDALSELADADDDRGPRIDHYRPPDTC